MQIRVEGINNSYQAAKILSLNSVSDSQKAEIIKQFPDSPQKLQFQISRSEFAQIMKNRPLVRFRPIKNSFLKRGDRMILATALNIETSQLDSTIANVVESNFSINRSISKDNIEQVKEYIYRHGSKDQLIEVLKNELSDVGTTLKKLYKLLDDETGGLYRYFERPCHFMDNNTMRKINNVITGSLDNAQNSGVISLEQNQKMADYALRKIYDIQNNSRIRRAAKVVYENS